MEHHVYFWLKEERSSAEGRAAFEAGLTELCKSSFIASAHWGAPADTPERPVTDHSFDYGLSVKFASMEDHRAYQENDEVHELFASSFKDWWAKVLVMDLA